MKSSFSPAPNIVPMEKFWMKYDPADKNTIIWKKVLVNTDGFGNMRFYLTISTILGVISNWKIPAILRGSLLDIEFMFRPISL